MVALDAKHPEAWRLLADHSAAIGDKAASESAYLRHLQSATGNPDLQQAAAAMIANELPTAERILKSHLKNAPTDVAAIRMLAEVAVRVGRNDDAQALLEYCLELTPGFSGARYNLAVLLHRTNKSDDALREVDQLLAEEPDRPGVPQFGGSCVQPDRRIRALKPALSGLIRRVSPECKSLAELRTCLKNRGETGGVRGGLSGCH